MSNMTTEPPTSFERDRRAAGDRRRIPTLLQRVDDLRVQRDQLVAAGKHEAAAKVRRELRAVEQNVIERDARRAAR